MKTDNTSPLLTVADRLSDHFSAVGTHKRRNLLDNREFTLIERLLYVHKNKNFGRDVELALRAACVVLLAGMPYTPQRIFGGGAVVMFIFTLWKTTGETIFLAACCIGGNILAAVDMWLILWVLDTHSSWLHYWILTINGYVFVTGICFLNLPVLSQQFAMANFVIYWMSAHAGHDIEPLMKQTVLWSFTGCILAVFTTVIPNPRWAIRLAEAKAHQLVKQTGQAFRLATAAYCNDVRDEYMVARLDAHLEGLREKLGVLEKDLKYSWYESFGIERRIRVRVMLSLFETTLKEVTERVFSIRNLCQREDFSPAHDAFVARVRDKTVALVNEAARLFEATVNAACTCGDVGPAEAELRDMVGSTMRASLEFTSMFSDAKGDGSLMNTELLEEHAFAMNILSFANKSCTCADAILSTIVGDGDVINISRYFSQEVLQSVKTFLSTFPSLLPTVNAEYLRHSLRHAFAILLGFHVGYIGIRGVINPYDPGCANTISLLLTSNDSLGSALKRNLDRISGVVLGTVLGQVVYAMFRECTFVDRLFMGVILWFWMAYTSFVRYNLQTFSMIGKLLAAFGAKNMLAGCKTGEFEADKAYSIIVNTSLSVVFFVFADTLSWETRASDRAHAAVVELFHALSAKMKSLLTPWESVEARKQTTKELVKKSNALKQDAYHEPRFWRIPWRHQLYDSVVTCAEEIDSMITMLEYSLLGGKSEDGGKYVAQEDVHAMLQLEPMQKLRQLMEAEFDKIVEMLGILVQEELDGDIPKEMGAERILPVLQREEMIQVREAFIGEANAKVLGCRDAPPESLMGDQVAQVSLLLASIDLMMLQLHRLRLKILRD